ncbi:hypothetical protein J6590_055529 [Homalodisca vitripennis]|nr:hypothetical protein J6590_055529 [Homalodisca vitripennis]
MKKRSSSQFLGPTPIERSVHRTLAGLCVQYSRYNDALTCSSHSVRVIIDSGRPTNGTGHITRFPHLGLMAESISHCANSERSQFLDCGCQADESEFLRLQE